MSALQSNKIMNTKYILAFVLLIVASCKKETVRLTSDIEGTWELTSMDGGWVGHKEFEPGNGNTLSFNGNKYTQRVKGTDTTYQYSGTFTIYNGKPCENANEQMLIKLNDDFPNSFSLSDEQLVIGTTICIADGANYT